MEVNWISKRVELWRLCRQSPTLSNRQLAKQLKISPSWVKKWKGRLRDVDGTDLRPFMSRSRRRKTSPKRVTEVVEAKTLHLRNHLTEDYQRRVGATNILYHLHHDDDLKRLNVYLPKSLTTLHDVLVRYYRIQRPGSRIHVLFSFRAIRTPSHHPICLFVPTSNASDHVSPCRQSRASASFPSGLVPS